MSIEARNSNEQVVGSKKYTGLANMLVRAINPTMEEIKALGGRADKEPHILPMSLQKQSRIKGQMVIHTKYQHTISHVLE